MHQYCLLNCACYIINTHPDMTWIWYDKGIRGEELEKERSECIFHELQSSPAKVLDMMFQFQRRKKGARRAREANMWLLGKQTWDFACNRTRADRPTSLITHPGDNFDRGPCAFLSATGSRPRSKKKKKNGNVIQHPLIFFFNLCLNIWWAVALLQLLILNKSEGWISLRVAFFHFFHHFLLRLVKL